MAAPQIKASVGAGSSNRDDILVIQQLLNLAGAGLVVDGRIGDKTIAAIKAYQRNFLAAPDGRVDPDGATFRNLVAGKHRVTTTPGAEFVPLPRPGIGFYSYSSADRQWGTADCIQALVDIGGTFRHNMPAVEIGIGDISFRNGGAMSPHTSHRAGLHVDIRPLRTDGKHLPVAFRDEAYSREYTTILVESLLAHRNVARPLLFNDISIAGVTPHQGHDNHLHVTMKR